MPLVSLTAVVNDAGGSAGIAGGSAGSAGSAGIAAGSAGSGDSGVRVVHQKHRQNPVLLFADAAFKALATMLPKCPTDIPKSVRVLGVDGVVAHCRILMSSTTQEMQDSLIHKSVTKFVGTHNTDPTAPITSVTLCGTQFCCQVVAYSVPGRVTIVPGSDTLSRREHPLTVCRKCSMSRHVFHEYRRAINMYAGVPRQPITDDALDVTHNAFVLGGNQEFYLQVTVDNPDKLYGERGDYVVHIEQPYDKWVTVGTWLYDNKHGVGLVVYATSGDTVIPSKRYGVVRAVRARFDSADPKPSEEIAANRREIEEKEISKRTKSSARSAGAASAAGPGYTETFAAGSAGSAGSAIAGSGSKFTSAIAGSAGSFSASGSGKMPGPRELRKMSNDRKRAAIKQEPRDDAYDSDATTPFFEGSDDDDDDKITLSKGNGKSKRARK